MFVVASKLGCYLLLIVYQEPGLLIECVNQKNYEAHKILLVASIIIW